MPDEREDPQEVPASPDSDREDEGTEESLDQSTVDELVSQTQTGEGPEDQLESLLSDMDVPSETEDEGGGTESTDADDLADDLEALLDQHETAEDDGGEEDTDDPLYQATLADAEQSVDEEAPAEEVSEEAGGDDLSAVLDGLDEEASDDTEEVEEEAPAEEASEEAGEDDLSAMLEGLDEEVSGDTEEVEEEAPAEEVSEEAGEDDLSAMLEGMDEETSDDTEEVEEDAPAEEVSEEAGEDELSAMLEGLDEEASEDAEEAEEEAGEPEEVEASAEAEDEDLDSLLEGLDEEAPAEAEVSEEAGEPEEIDASAKAEDEDLDSLLEGLDEDAPEEVEEAADEDFDSLLVGLDEDEAAPEPTVEEDDEDLDSLLEDLDSEPDSETSESEDLDALLDDDLEVGGEEDILDEFRSVQEILVAEGDEDHLEATVLLIDDDPDNRALFRDALSGAEGAIYDFVEVDETNEGLDAMQDQSVDLILLNLDLGVDDPLGFLKEVAGSPDGPSIPVIVSSEITEQIESALHLGAADYFTRPLGVIDLEFQVPKKVSNLLKLQRAERLLAGAGGGTIVSDGPVLPDVEDVDDDLSDLDALVSDDSGPRPEDILAGVGTSGGTAVAERKRRGRLVPVSDQERMAIEREQKSDYRRSRPSRMPLILGLMALLVALVGASYVAVEYFNVMKTKVPEPVALTPQEPLPSITPPAVTQQGYVMSGTESIKRPDTYQRQAEVSKIRVRQTV
ncbi:MAG: response regulator, partial [Candidatus Latescibacteria bacterium]|nr:response regulator [Candidatus Latescibacterota bacterium]